MLYAQLQTVFCLIAPHKYSVTFRIFLLFIIFFKCYLPDHSKCKVRSWQGFNREQQYVKKKRKNKDYYYLDSYLTFYSGWIYNCQLNS